MNQKHTIKERQAIQWFKLGRYWLQTASQSEDKEERERYLLRSGRAFNQACKVHDKPWTLID